MSKQDSFSSNQTISENFDDFFSTQLADLSRLITQIMNSRNNSTFELQLIDEDFDQR